jgi:hypothetical protein
MTLRLFSLLIVLFASGVLAARTAWPPAQAQALGAARERPAVQPAVTTDALQSTQPVRVILPSPYGVR